MNRSRLTNLLLKQSYAVVRIRHSFWSKYEALYGVIGACRLLWMAVDPVNECGGTLTKSTELTRTQLEEALISELAIAFDMFHSEVVGRHISIIAEMIRTENVSERGAYQLSLPTLFTGL